MLSKIFYVLGFKQIACVLRGGHVGLNCLGLCLSCGKTSDDRRPVAPPSIVREFRPITAIAADDMDGKRAAFDRNQQIREVENVVY